MYLRMKRRLKSSTYSGVDGIDVVSGQLMPLAPSELQNYLQKVSLIDRYRTSIELGLIAGLSKPASGAKTWGQRTSQHGPNRGFEETNNQYG